MRSYMVFNNTESFQIRHTHTNTQNAPYARVSNKFNSNPTYAILSRHIKLFAVSKCVDQNCIQTTFFAAFCVEAIMVIACDARNKAKTNEPNKVGTHWEEAWEKLCAGECRFKSRRRTGKIDTRQTDESTMMNKCTANNGTGTRGAKKN